MGSSKSPLRTPWPGLCYLEEMGSKPSIQSIWLRRVRHALRKKDASSLLRLECERITTGQGLGLVGHGVLGIAATGLNEWGVDTALGFDTPPPDFSLVLHHLTYKNPSRRDVDLPVGQRLLEKVIAASPPSALVKMWEEGLASWDADFWLLPTVKRFKDAGVDVTARRAFNPSPSDPSYAQRALPPMPEPYDVLCGQALREGNEPYWGPLLACWLNPKPRWALELIQEGLDPWAPSPATILPDWTLAGALGLDNTRVVAPPLDKMDEGWDMAPWVVVKAAALEHRLSAGLLDPSLESAPSVPRHRF